MTLVPNKINLVLKIQFTAEKKSKLVPKKIKISAEKNEIGAKQLKKKPN